jgi:hypothetical protein
MKLVGYDFGMAGGAILPRQKMIFRKELLILKLVAPDCHCKAAR